MTIYGECSKHPGSNMVNCQMCAIEKGFTVALPTPSEGAVERKEEGQIPQEKEKELTAMQELIEWIKVFGFAEGHESTRDIILLKATSLLPSERQAIEEAFHHGYNNGNIDTNAKASDYFTTRYKQ